MTQPLSITCPLPVQRYPQVLLAHGGGGKLMHQLIQELFLPAFGSAAGSAHDAATLVLPGQRMAFTTDSYVVKPLFFPGGNIGTLAVTGTVNDLAMAGSRPLYLSVGFILEEGLAMETLWQVVQAMQTTATAIGVKIVTGDTKVVDRGKGDGIYINTAGVGIITTAPEQPPITPLSIQPGDAIILSGDLGRHGVAIMAAREGLEFETTIESDCAPLHRSVQALLATGIDLHCLRDVTRGGLASTLNELAQATQLGMRIEETEIEVLDQVQGACEILGLDPLYIANEGRFVAIVPLAQAAVAVTAMNQHNPPGVTARIIGQVTPERPGQLILHNRLGTDRLVDMMSGEQLPRIC
ncbi:hydrogenase expression/formation protein HypE [Prochlorothrix hollandica]|uniref:hydrogenase expression/formation protein HypE n=1 Tax=Prochlorothrix hollandica TaxID=1223 RepID=UPI0033407C47